VLGTPYVATVTIADNEPVVSVGVRDGAASEDDALGAGRGNSSFVERVRPTNC
jgi:hypothetical protein